MVCLFSCLCAAPHMYSGAGNGNNTVGNQTDRQPGSLFLWGHRLRAGTDDYVFLIFTDCASYFKGEKREKTARVVKVADGTVWRLDSWRTADRSLVSDEVVCVGSAFLKISLSQFLKIGIIAKIISIGMIAFSGFLGNLCGLRRWQMITVELLFLFLAAAALQHFGKKGVAKLS